jgi:hypothetical protein
MKSSRRAFLRAFAGAGLAAWSSGTALFADDAPAADSATLTVKTNRRDRLIPAGYVGLSYEVSQLADPNYFSADNTALLGLLRGLGSSGAIRIGGNTSDHAIWRANGDTTPVPKAHIVTPDDVARLAAFVKATGWKLIYGLNLGTGSPADAADQAAAATAAAGDSLLAFQIGNEVNLYSHNGLRPKTWIEADYLAEWQIFADAVRARVPQAPLAGPDTAGNGSWVPEVGRKDGHELAFLSQHYYAEGPGKSPKSTISRMLHSQHKLDSMLRILQDARRHSHLPYRMTEANSCYGGGRYGVSDTLAAALWGLNFLYQTVVHDCDGVNFHGGPHGAYSPTIRNADGSYTAQPLYYGMRLFALGAQGRLAHVTLQGAGPGVMAYAAQDETALRITVINTDAAQAVNLAVRPGHAYGQGTALRLTAPALDATTALLLGGASIGGNGSWTPTNSETITMKGNSFPLHVPAASAVLVTLR